MSAAHQIVGAGLHWDQSDLSNTANEDQLATAPWLSLCYLHNVRNRLLVHTACLQLHTYFLVLLSITQLVLSAKQSDCSKACSKRVDYYHKA